MVNELPESVRTSLTKALGQSFQAVCLLVKVNGIFDTQMRIKVATGAAVSINAYFNNASENKVFGDGMWQQTVHNECNPMASATYLCHWQRGDAHLDDLLTRGKWKPKLTNHLRLEMALSLEPTDYVASVNSTQGNRDVQVDVSSIVTLDEHQNQKDELLKEFMDEFDKSDNDDESC